MTMLHSHFALVGMALALFGAASQSIFIHTMFTFTHFVNCVMNKSSFRRAFVVRASRRQSATISLVVLAACVALTIDVVGVVHMQVELWTREGITPVLRSTASRLAGLTAILVSTQEAWQLPV
jgi:hypothetical protein